LPVWFPDDTSLFRPTYEHSYYPGQVFGVLGPTPRDAIREIGTLIEVGVSHFQVVFEDMRTLGRFIEEVLPAVVG
jgi:hypothetical protein